MSAHHQIVFMNHQIADGGCGHVEAQRLPVVPVVERDVHRQFCSGEEQAFADGVFAHDVDRSGGEALDDLFPGRAAIVGAIDVGR